VRGIKSLALIGLTWVLVSVGCINQPHGAVEPPYIGNFTYSGEPKLGQEFDVVFYIEPHWATDFDITIKIPDGLELIEGNTTFHGNLSRLIPVVNGTLFDRKNLNLKLKANKEGTHKIEAKVIGNGETASYRLFVTSSKNSGKFSRQPPRGLWPQVRTQLQKSSEEANT